MLITLHRREAWETTRQGARSERCSTASSAASADGRSAPDVDFIYPVHLNPRCKEPRARVRARSAMSASSSLFRTCVREAMASTRASSSPTRAASRKRRRHSASPCSCSAQDDGAPRGGAARRHQSSGRHRIDRRRSNELGRLLDSPRPRAPPQPALPEPLRRRYSARSRRDMPSCTSWAARDRPEVSGPSPRAVDASTRDASFHLRHH